MNILEDLYSGNINLIDQCFEHNSEYAKFFQIFADNEEKLTTFLSSLPNSEKEQHMFRQMLNTYNEMGRFTEYDRFIEGFRLGAGIMLETFVYPQQSVIRDIT